MVERLALSDNCPYDIDSLWSMHVQELFKVKDKAYIRDALEVARNLDARDKK